MTRLEGRLVLADGVYRGAIEFAEKITEISLEGAAAGSLTTAAAGPLLLPGFIDVHVHGGGGGDTMDGPEGVLTLAAAHLEHGTTSLLATTITSPWSAVIGALEGVAEAVTAQRAGLAPQRLPQVLGAHLEGPFISPQRLGAQPPFAVLPTPELVAEVLALGVVRVVTLAPELPGASEAARLFAANGVRVSLGHTVAAYEQVAAVVRAVESAGGVVGFTHLFNAMSQLGSREPGVVGAALSLPDTYAELILDLHHVHPASFRATLAAKPERLLLISDAIRAAGTAVRETELGGAAVLVQGGAARLADGTLAGSVLTLDVALRNALGAGLALHEAARLSAAVPAAYLGLDDRGSLAPGKRADIVVLDDELEISEVYVAGSRVV